MRESPQNESMLVLLSMGKRCDLREGNMCGIFPEIVTCDTWGSTMVEVHLWDKGIQGIT